MTETNTNVAVMTQTETGSISAPPNHAPAPKRRVRVRLRRINCEVAKAHPPKGEERQWWQELKRALGTTSNSFVDASLYQLQAACRLPGAGICEISMNAALALVGAAEPRDELESALVQMAATHAASLAVLGRLGGAHGNERRIAALGSAAARLLRAYVTQFEALRRVRHGGVQTIRIERLDVRDGGQAVVGAVAPT
jgi:hypothetical protein